jgi:thiosulfate/3-mercaptopyruvate sulfurtransferase
MDPSLLVSTDWLADHLDDADLRVFDATVHLEPTPRGLEARSGRADYEATHVPGAGFLDLLSDLSDLGSKLRFTRPAPEQVARVLARSGISHDHRVVIYSAGSVMWATRAWWLARWVGLPNVAVLDGGLAKWQVEGRPLSGEPCRYPEAALDPRATEGLWASKQDVLAAIGDGAVCTINALPRAVHTGEAAMGYQRPGRIAGSENLPFSELLRPEDGRFRSADELREHFSTTGALEKDRVICYCGGGIAATQNAFALSMLGHPSVAVYDGSLDEWSRDPELPMETGTA